MKASFWKYEPLFAFSEFACRCGQCPPTSGLNMRISHMNKLEQMRRACEAAAKYAGEVDFAFPINSGYRCISHKREWEKPEGGTHNLGYSCDVQAMEGTWRYNWISDNAHKFGFHRIGRAKTFIHLDSFGGDSRMPCPAEWTYQ